MDIDRIVAEYSGTPQATYRLFADRVQELLTILLKRADIQPHSITNREKSPASLREKIQRDDKSYANPLEDITDLAAVRVITYFPTDVDKVVPIIEREFDVDPDHSVDKRKTADPAVFGYASVHLVVGLSADRLRLAEYSVFNRLKCEIQVRTILQHAWAEIEHDIVYKSSHDIPFELRRRFASLAGLLEIADREFEFLRHDETRVRDEIQSTIQSDDLRIPIDMESLSFYLQRFHNEKEPSPFVLSNLVKVLVEYHVESIEALHKMLSKEALAEADSKLHQIPISCGGPACLVRYAMVLGKRLGIKHEKLGEVMKCPALEDIERLSTIEAQSERKHIQNNQ